MERRRYLGLVAAVTTGGLAGCSGAGLSGVGMTVTPAPRPTEIPATPGPVAGAVELPVRKSELEIAGFKDSIPAITEPAFASDWQDVELQVAQQRIAPDFDFEFEPRLELDDPVIGVQRGSTARAYPLGVLNWFEVVNDWFPADGDEEPLLVTYCPLCRTGLVAERTVDGEPTRFGVSGLLYRDNLVMYDQRTSSLWSQIRAQAIRGPMTGRRLSLVPSTLTTWAEWRRQHPDTVVLLPPPMSVTVHGRVVRDVTKSPYGGYDNSSRLGVGPGVLGDGRLHPKALVIGVRSDSVARAYPLGAVLDAGVVNDVVGDRPVVVAATDGTLAAYDRRVGGRPRTFERVGPDHIEAAGSRWDIATGAAVDGPYQGMSLTPASSASAMFWFAWVQFNPDTKVWNPGT